MKSADTADALSTQSIILLAFVKRASQGKSIPPIYIDMSNGRLTGGNLHRLGEYNEL